MNLSYPRAMRALPALLLGLLLTACGEAEQQAQALAPTAFHPGDECHVCGMLIVDFPGPKGQAVESGGVKKFCSTAEMIGWWLQPENRHLQARLYVHDMGRSVWDQPDDEHLVEASSAYYVAGTRLKGAMGVVLASFADEQAAHELAAREGGRVLRFEEIDLDVLQPGLGAHRGEHAGH